MGENPWTPELIQQLRDSHSAGHPMAEIGRRLGMSKNACIGKARRLGLDQRENMLGMAIGQEKTEMAQKLIAQGMPAVEIAGLVGIHDDTVRGIRKRMGIEPPPPRPRSSSPGRAAVMGHVLAVMPPPAPRPVIIHPEPIPAPEPLRIDTARTCCWPVGEPRTKTFRFCADAPVMGKPYCGAHCSVAYLPIRRRAGVEEAA